MAVRQGVIPRAFICILSQLLIIVEMQSYKKRGVKKFHIPLSTVGVCPGVMRDAGPAPPRIIKLYQIFPFKVNYGTIRMELWIGCAPYRLTVFVESDHRLHSIC